MKLCNYRKIAAFIPIMAVVLQAWAYNLKGGILSANKPVTDIVVKVSDKDGKELKQTSTDDKGKFRMNNLNFDKIFIEIDSNGYDPIRIEVSPGDAGASDIDLGTLHLIKSVSLDEVTVTAGSRIRRPDKTMVYVTDIERKRAADPFNMLTILSYKAPQIHVRESERTLTIDGEEPQILVNGIKRPMSFISSIKQDAIEKIEFSTLPDLRFGKRYLNIITRRPVEGGWVMADITGALTTPRNFFSGVAEYTRGKNDFMFYYNGGYRHGTKEYSDGEERYSGGGREITLGVEGMPSSTLDKYHNLNFYFTRVPSDNSMFAATGFLNIHDNKRNIHDHVTDLSLDYDRTTNRGYSRLSPGINLYYYLKASEKALIEWNAVGSYDDFSSHRNLSYSTGYDSRLSSTGHTWYFATEAVWKQSLPFAGLNTGISFSYNDADNNYIIDGSKSHTPLSSTNMTVYTSMNGSIMTVGYDLGAGLQYYKVDQDMVSPDLRLSLQKNLGNDFSLSYNFRYNPGMPPISNYNDVATPVNELMYHIGTENLKRQLNLTNQLQFEFNKNKFYLSVQGSLMNVTHPLITDYSYQNNSDETFYGFFLEKPCNGRKLISYGTDCNVGLSNLWNFISVSASTGWNHHRLETSETFTFSSCYLDFKVAAYWKGWQLNFTAENLVPSWSMWGSNEKTRRWPYTSLAIYKNIGNWNLHAAWNNLFSRYGGRYRTETLSSVVTRSSDYRMNDQGNMLEIGIRYQFSTGKLLSKKRRSVNLSGKADNGMRWDY